MSYLFNKKNWLSHAKNIGITTNIVILIVSLSLVATITELFGIGIFLPIFQFIRLEGDLNALIADSSVWRYLINVFTYFDLSPTLLILLLISFSLFLSRQLFIYIRIVYTQTIIEKIVQTQRNRLFHEYLNANSDYHDDVPVGSLVNIIMTEIDNAVYALMGPMGVMVYVIMLIGYLSLLFLLSWEMTTASVIILLIVSMIPRVWIKQSAQTGRKLVDANTLIAEFLVSRLRSPRLVVLSGTKSAEKKEFNSLTSLQRQHRVRKVTLSAKTTVSMDPIVIGLSLAFLYFSYTILHLQIEIIGLYLVIILRLMPVVQGIITKLQAIQGSLGSVEILEGRFDAMKKSLEKDMGTKDLDRLRKSILLSNVSYRYPSGINDSLKGVDVEFKANEVTAIVGPSGSGKSTLIDLLPCLRLPTKGLISIDGVNIKEFTLKSIRQMMSYVSQYPQIFNGTVKNHILYGKVNASDNEVLVAARLAGAEDFINQLPQGFYTVIGEDAIKLSGGQKQRLDIARALVRRAPILILDEPASNLDAASDKKFKEVITRIRKETNTTVVIVSHRLKSISDSDNIIVLNQGIVESTGCHSELLGKNGWYAKAWKIQNS